MSEVSVKNRYKLFLSLVNYVFISNNLAHLGIPWWVCAVLSMFCSSHLLWKLLEFSCQLQTWEEKELGLLFIFTENDKCKDCWKSGLWGYQWDKVYCKLRISFSFLWQLCFIQYLLPFVYLVVNKWLTVLNQVMTISICMFYLRLMMI